jgi:hypothetical protein
MEPTDQLDAPDRGLPASRVGRLVNGNAPLVQPRFFRNSFRFFHFSDQEAWLVLALEALFGRDASPAAAPISELAWAAGINHLEAVVLRRVTTGRIEALNAAGENLVHHPSLTRANAEA